MRNVEQYISKIIFLMTRYVKQFPSDFVNKISLQFPHLNRQLAPHPS